MNDYTLQLNELFDKIPRRHSPENVKEIYAILDDYEALLQSIEGKNKFFEELVASFFDELEPIRSMVTKSSDNKASKKTKDSLFDEASVALKDTMEGLKDVLEKN